MPNENFNRNPPSNLGKSQRFRDRKRHLGELRSRTVTDRRSDRIRLYLGQTGRRQGKEVHEFEIGQAQNVTCEAAGKVDVKIGTQEAISLFLCDDCVPIFHDATQK